jgi:hypothetical protein
MVDVHGADDGAVQDASGLVARGASPDRAPSFLDGADAD